MEKTNYYDKLSAIQSDIEKEIKEELSRIGERFTSEDDDPLTIFAFKNVAEIELTSIEPDGTFVVSGKDNLTLDSLIGNGDISLYDAISLLEDLREL